MQTTVRGHSRPCGGQTVRKNYGVPNTVLKLSTSSFQRALASPKVLRYDRSRYKSYVAKTKLLKRMRAGSCTAKIKDSSKNLFLKGRMRLSSRISMSSKHFCDVQISTDDDDYAREVTNMDRAVSIEQVSRSVEHVFIENRQVGLR